MPKKPTHKPRNAGTMTEAAFFGMLRSHLRRLSIRWKPMQLAKQKARVKYAGENKRRKWSYECAECKGLFPDTEIAVDHIIPCGSLKSFEDLGGFAERMFCEVDCLQILCNECHLIKSQQEREK